MATCPYCKTTKPSSPDLPFFEAAEDRFDKCAAIVVPLGAPCGVARCLHREGSRYDHDFVLGTPMGETFYCGCRGWD